MDRNDVISHLQIMHTWASFAREKDQNFFNDGHFRSIEEWTEDAIALLKEQEAVIEQYHKADGFLYVHGWKWEGR